MKKIDSFIYSIKTFFFNNQEIIILLFLSKIINNYQKIILQVSTKNLD